MDLPPLTNEKLSALLGSSRSPAERFEILADYEAEACLMEGTGDVELLGAFYSGYFITHLLVDEM